jgi:hypothetical protein
MRSRSRRCVGCSWRWGWPVGSPEWVEDMRAARVPLVDGMVPADPHTGKPGTAWADGTPGVIVTRRINEDDGRLIREAAGYVPWIEDRATFLLCLDEAERRGVESLRDPDGQHVASIDGSAWGAYMWSPGGEFRALLIRALARALRETAPGGGR